MWRENPHGGNASWRETFMAGKVVAGKHVAGNSENAGSLAEEPS